MTDTPLRRAPGLIIELAIVMAVLVGTKLIFDQIAWRFAGPISLAFTLVTIAGFTSRHKESWASFGPGSRINDLNDISGRYAKQLDRCGYR